nr:MULTISPECIES: integrase core domain-containing protein [unclassified Microvirga]
MALVVEGTNHVGNGGDPRQHLAYRKIHSDLLSITGSESHAKASLQRKSCLWLIMPKIYGSIGELQTDLDAWVRSYNEERPHQGRWCFGKTPMQTFVDGMPLAKEKMIAA